MRCHGELRPRGLREPGTAPARSSIACTVMPAPATAPADDTGEESMVDDRLVRGRAGGAGSWSLLGLRRRRRRDDPAAGAAHEHLRAQAGGPAAVRPRGRGDRGHDRPEGVGTELAGPVRLVPEDRRSRRRRSTAGAGWAPATAAPPSRSSTRSRGSSASSPATRSRIDYRDRRGHAYALFDQEQTRRVTEKKQPGACIQCHASNLALYRFAARATSRRASSRCPAMPYDEARNMKDDKGQPLVQHPVACVDCHDPADDGAARDPARLHRRDQGAEGQAGRRGLRPEPRRHAARRCASFVCGQCHVEYYFKGEGKVVTYPVGERAQGGGDRGLLRQGGLHRLGARGDRAPRCSRRSIPSSRSGTRASTRAPASRAPTATCPTSGSARSRSATTGCGARCSTSTAPASPVTRSPRRSSQARVLDDPGPPPRAARSARRRPPRTCWTPSWRAKQGRRDRGRPRRRPPTLHRKAQWRLDFVAAENSMGFHAPQELARILGETIDYARQGQLSADRAARRR